MKIRVNEIRKVARKLEMGFHETDEWGLKNQLADFRLFRRGFRGRIRNVMRKQEGMMNSDVRIFDYRYLVSTGKSARRIEQTVFFIESKSLSLPDFRMQPETIFHKIIEMLGAQDIDFDTFPDFSANYQLQGEDDDYIRHHFNEEVLGFFSREKGWMMEGLGFYLILYKKNKLFRPGYLQTLHRKGMWLAKAF